MKRVRVIGIRCKRLLATKLSVEILLGSQMAEAGLTERSRGWRRGRVKFPGIFGPLPGARDGS